MRDAPLSNFYKLWGRINTNLEPGDYKMKITDGETTYSTGVRKHFYLTTLSESGGKNLVLSIGHIIAGAVCLVLTLIFITGHMNRKEKLQWF